MESTEEWHTILDTDEDEDPLRLSSPSSPESVDDVPPVDCRQKISENTSRKRVIPTRVVEDIEVIDLDPPTPPSNPIEGTASATIKENEGSKDQNFPETSKVSEHFPEVFTSPKRKRLLQDEITSTMNKLFIKPATNSDIFNKFKEICMACDNTSDTREIINKKIKRRYEQAEPSYLESADFCNLLEENISIMAKNPTLVFNCLVNVDAEMKSKKKKVGKNIVKTTPNKQSKSTDSKPSTSSKHQKEDSERRAASKHAEETSQSKSDDRNQPSTSSQSQEYVVNEEQRTESQLTKEERKQLKKEKHIKSLNKALVKCHKKVQRLEEKEVDWDNEDEDDDSAYLLMQRYRRRCIDIHRKIVQLTGARDEAIKRRARVACVSPYTNVSAAIERYVSANGTFPDLHDVLKIYTDAKIGLRPGELHAQAVTTFKEIGNQIQKDRQVYDWNLACYFLGSEPDPAEDDPQLMLKLKNNKKLGDSKLDELMTSFTRRQYEMQLVAADVPDDEAAGTDDSEGDDDDDDDEEDASEDGHFEDHDSHSETSSTSSRQQSRRRALDKKSKRGKEEKKTKVDKKPAEIVNKPRKEKIYLDTPLPEHELWSMNDDSVLMAKMRPLSPPLSSKVVKVAEVEAPLTPRSSQPQPAKVNVVTPLKKNQEESLLNYLEIKHRVPASDICVPGSPTAKSSVRKRAASPVPEVDSTESSVVQSFEKTGSDPEVTSTSGDNDFAQHARKVDVGAQTVSKHTGSTPAKKKMIHTPSPAKVQDKASTAAFASSLKSYKSGVDMVIKVVDKVTGRTSSAVAATKSPIRDVCKYLPGNSCVEESKDAPMEINGSLIDLPSNVEVLSASSGCGKSVTIGNKTALSDDKIMNKMVVEENMTEAKENPVNVDNSSFNYDVVDTMFEEESLVALQTRAKDAANSSSDETVNLEDWENMIIPTMVAKEVLLVATDAADKSQETEIVTTELDLDSSDEYIQTPPIIKTYERKGRKIVPIRNPAAAKEQSEMSAVGCRSSPSIVTTPKILKTDRLSAKKGLVETNPSITSLGKKGSKIVPSRQKIVVQEKSAASELETNLSCKVVATPPKMLLIEDEVVEVFSVRKDPSSSSTVSALRKSLTSVKPKSTDKDITISPIVMNTGVVKLAREKSWSSTSSKRTDFKNNKSNIVFKEKSISSEIGLSSKCKVRTPPELISIEILGQAQALQLQKIAENCEQKRKNFDGTVSATSTSGKQKAAEVFTASKGVSHTSQNVSQSGGSPEKFKTHRKGEIISGANRGRTLFSLDDGQGTSQMEPSIFKVKRNADAKVSNLVPHSTEAFQTKPTARKSFPGKGMSNMKVYPAAKDFAKKSMDDPAEACAWKITSVYSEQSLLTEKTTAKKSIPGTNSGLKYLSVKPTKSLLKNEVGDHQLERGKQGSIKSRGRKNICPDVITIDSD